MDIGTTLRDARENRGLSIDAVARTTKINAGVLRAIELNAFERLPAEVFTRGFLRAYAREVGVDPDDTVREYAAELARTAAAEALTGAMPAPSRPPESGWRMSWPTSFATPQWRMTTPVLAAAVIYLLFVALAPRRAAAPPTHP